MRWCCPHKRLALDVSTVRTRRQRVQQADHAVCEPQFIAPSLPSLTRVSWRSLVVHPAICETALCILRNFARQVRDAASSARPRKVEQSLALPCAAQRHATWHDVHAICCTACDSRRVRPLPDGAFVRKAVLLLPCCSLLPYRCKCKTLAASSCCRLAFRSSDASRAYLQKTATQCVPRAARMPI